MKTKRRSTRRVNRRSARRVSRRSTRRTTRRSTRRVPRRSVRRTRQRSVRRNNTQRKQIYSLYNGDQWDNYRLGDVIYGHFICWNRVCLNKEIKDETLMNTLCENLAFDMEDSKVNQKWCSQNKEQWADLRNNKLGYLDSLTKNYPDSIASQYIKKVGYPKNYSVSDFTVLKSIFSKLSYDKPDPSSLVIHLRLGDVLSKKYIDEYLYDFVYYQELLNRIKKNKKIKQVDIVTGLHKNMFVKKSNDYLKKIVKLFEKDYPVKVVLTKNPDKDLYYMCHSKFFANAGGGFSRIVLNYLKEKTKARIYTDDTAGGGRPKYPKVTYEDYTFEHLKHRIFK
jgi:hypothetical protein